MGGVQCCLASRPPAKLNIKFRRGRDMEMRKRAWAILRASKVESNNYRRLTRFSMGDRVEIMRSANWRPATVLRVAKGHEQIQVRWDDTFRLDWILCGLGDIRLKC